jgi:hypothetical protein
MIREFNFRSILLCAMLLAGAAMFTPSRAAAQNDNCVCDWITVNVELAVRCRVTICVLDPAGNRRCVTIPPGTRQRIPCIPGAVVGFIDCTNTFVPFQPGHGGCHIGIGAGPNCCVIDACLAYDAAGCPMINIRPSIVDSCPCP